jgi:hypothetical protein
MNEWIGSKLIKRIFTVLIIAFLSFSVILSYLNKALNSIPANADQTQVRHTLKLFRESKAPSSEIKAAYHSGLALVTNYRIYRYDFLGCPALSIHIVYDASGHVAIVQPTFE